MLAFLGSMFCLRPRAFAEKKDDDEPLIALEKWMQKYDVQYVHSDNTLDGLETRAHDMFIDLLKLRPLDTMEEQITEHCQCVVKNGTFIARDIIVRIMFPIAKKDDVLTKIFFIVKRTPLNGRLYYGTRKWKPFIYEKGRIVFLNLEEAAAAMVSKKSMPVTKGISEEANGGLSSVSEKKREIQKGSEMGRGSL